MIGTIRTLVVGASIAVAAAAPPAHAQSLSRVESGARPAAGPTMTSASIALRAPDAAARERAPDTQAMLERGRSGLSQSQTLMIIGGAAFLAGAIIGDDAGTIIMIGGAGVGLYGLYLYLQ